MDVILWFVPATGGIKIFDSYFHILIVWEYPPLTRNMSIIKQCDSVIIEVGDSFIQG